MRSDINQPHGARCIWHQDGQLATNFMHCLASTCVYAKMVCGESQCCKSWMVWAYGELITANFSRGSLWDAKDQEQYWQSRNGDNPALGLPLTISVWQLWLTKDDQWIVYISVCEGGHCRQCRGSTGQPRCETTNSLPCCRCPLCESRPLGDSTDGLWLTGWCSGVNIYVLPRLPCTLPLWAVKPLWILWTNSRP